MHLLTSFAALVILTHRYAEAGQHCFSCNAVPSPHACTHVTLCGDHESCFTESIVSSSGIVLYNVGCMSKAKCSSSQSAKRDDLVTCIECCNTDYCNKEGCGVIALAPENRGLYCYHCDVQESQNSCQDITLCGRDEACTLEPNMALLPGIYYKSRCGEKSMCLEAQEKHNNEQSTTNPAVLIVGKRRSMFGDCPACCYTDFCNNNCTQNNSVAMHGITHITTSFPITNATVATLTSEAPTSTTTHPEMTKTTKLVTDVNQHHTSIHNISSAPHTTTHVPRITQASHDCSQNGNGYIQTRHLCMKFHFDVVSFKYAATACSKEGAMLVTVDTEEKMNEIWTELQAFSTVHVQDLWIGGSDVNHTDTFYWQNGGEIRPYTNWGTQPQQPSDPHYHDQDCIILHRADNYTWYDEPCSRAYGFICEHPMQAIHTSTQPTKSCESQDGFHLLEHNLGCVMYVQIAMDWQSANEYCIMHQSHIVSINSQRTQDAVHRFAISHGADSNPWIGLVSTATPPHNVHHWRWVSGLPYAYKNWAVNHPEGAGTCVVMNSNGHWRNRLCSSHHTVICQK